MYRGQSIRSGPGLDSSLKRLRNPKLRAYYSSTATSTWTSTSSHKDEKSMGVIVTGGTRGIGLAIAQHFHAYSAAPYKVCVLSRSPRPDSLPKDIEHIRADVSKSSATILEDLKQRVGADSPLCTPHVLVNAAGIAQSSFLQRTSEEAVSTILDANLKGTIWLSKLFGKRMLSGLGSASTDQSSTNWHSPSIINVSSLLGIKGGQAAAVYAASKAGVLAFTRAMALEYGRSGVRVNAIVPGYIETDMTKDFSSEMKAAILQEIPLKKKRFGTPEEIAEAAVFLARNEYANNCVINLDGGLSAT